MVSSARSTHLVVSERPRVIPPRVEMRRTPFIHRDGRDRRYIPRAAVTTRSDIVVHVQSSETEATRPRLPRAQQVPNDTGSSRAPGFDAAACGEAAGLADALGDGTSLSARRRGFADYPRDARTCFSLRTRSARGILTYPS